MMRTPLRIAWLLGMGILAIACGDGTDSYRARPSSPDYARCNSLTGGPLTATCEGLNCAEDEEARHFLALFLNVLREHGVAAQHTVLNAKTVGEFFQIEYVVSIDWFRGSNACLRGQRRRWRWRRRGSRCRRSASRARANHGGASGDGQASVAV